MRLVIQRLSGSLPAALLVLTVAFGPARVATGQLLNDMTDALVRVEMPAVQKIGKRDRYQTLSDPVDTEYNGVVFSVWTSATDLVGDVRFRSDAGWTDWTPMYIVTSATDDGTVMGGYRGDVFRSSRFELRFDIDGKHALILTGVGIFDSRLDADYTARTGRGDVLQKQPVEVRGSVPSLITRQEWGAAPFIGQPVPLAGPSYDYLTFHHAAGFRATTREEGIAQVKAIQDLHQNVRGWSDIGYQFVIDRGGHLYQGRPFLDGRTTLDEVPRLALGAHVGGFNTGNIGICLLGCYHPPEGSFCTDTITPEAYDTYVQTFAFISDNYGVPPDRIRGHRDFSSTACPGDNNYALLPQLIEDVRSFVPESTGPPDALTLEQNYPNPFHDATRLRYYLDEGGVVSLKVYDIVGREVAVLASGFQEGESWYTVEFDAGRVSAGMYYYRLEISGLGNRKSSRSATMTVVR